MTIKSWPLALLTLVFFCLFMSLSFWQWHRAEQKTLLLASHIERIKKSPLSTLPKIPSEDLRFRRVRLTGHFDNKQTFLLDNKTFRHQVGYEVYTPFISKNLTTPLLIDRGFVPMTQHRDKLPKIAVISGTVTITGMLNTSPSYASLGKIRDTAANVWPMRIEYVHLPELSKLSTHSFYPLLLILDPKNPLAYPNEWQIIIMPPEKHRAYALQWFALALTLLILFVALNRHKGSPS